MVHRPLSSTVSLTSGENCPCPVTYQSEACQASKIDAARTASEFSREKLLMASRKPFSALPEWNEARFFVSIDRVNQAR